ncbi:MAG: hypothetical protein AAF387_20130 [Pseudomonadota bacterium]
MNDSYFKFANGVKLIFAITIFLLATLADAATLSFYTDRTTWQNEAASQGLSVIVEDFSSNPGSLPMISVGGINFETSATVDYNAGSGWIGYTTGGGVVLTLDYLGGSTSMFGFGLDIGPISGNIRVTDVTGDDLAMGNGEPSPHFIGVLGDFALDPANPFPSNPPLSGVVEFLTSGLGGSGDVYFDNLSVAVAPIPVPAMVWPFALILIGIRKRFS